MNSIDGSVQSSGGTSNLEPSTVTDPTTATGTETQSGPRAEGELNTSGGTTNPEPTSGTDSTTTGGDSTNQQDSEAAGDFNFALEHDDFDYGWDEEDEF